MPDPGFPVSCPKCGQRLYYLFTGDAMHVYHCLTDGVMVLPPGGAVRPETPDEAAQRSERARLKRAPGRHE